MAGVVVGIVVVVVVSSSSLCLFSLDACDDFVLLSYDTAKGLSFWMGFVGSVAFVSMDVHDFVVSSSFVGGSVVVVGASVV